MDAHTAGVHSFAEAVMMNSTPEPRRWTDVARFRSVASYGNTHQCRVCAFSISKMAVHRHSDDANVVEHEQCSGAAMFSTSYAHAGTCDGIDRAHHYIVHTCSRGTCSAGHSREGGDSALEEYATLPEGAACMAS